MGQEVFPSNFFMKFILYQQIDRQYINWINSKLSGHYYIDIKAPLLYKNTSWCGAKDANVIVKCLFISKFLGVLLFWSNQWNVFCAQTTVSLVLKMSTTVLLNLHFCKLFTCTYMLYREKYRDIQDIGKSHEYFKEALCPN